MYYKKPSPLKPILICMIISGLIGGYVFYIFPSESPDNLFGNSILMRLIVALIMGLCASIFGAIPGFIIYLIFKPSNIIINEQLPYKNYTTDKVNQLKDLNNLRKSGAITEDEFNKLKNDIINRN